MHVKCFNDLYITKYCISVDIFFYLQYKLNGRSLLLWISPWGKCMPKGMRNKSYMVLKRESCTLIPKGHYQNASSWDVLAMFLRSTQTYCTTLAFVFSDLEEKQAMRELSVG